MCAREIFSPKRVRYVLREGKGTDWGFIVIEGKAGLMPPRWSSGVSNSLVSWDGALSLSNEISQIGEERAVRRQESCLQSTH